MIQKIKGRLFSLRAASEALISKYLISSTRFIQSGIVTLAVWGWLPLGWAHWIWEQSRKLEIPKTSPACEADEEEN